MHTISKALMLLVAIFKNRSINVATYSYLVSNADVKAHIRFSHQFLFTHYNFFTAISPEDNIINDAVEDVNLEEKTLYLLLAFIVTPSV